MHSPKLILEADFSPKIKTYVLLYVGLILLLTLIGIPLLLVWLLGLGQHVSRLHASMELSVATGRVDKFIELRLDETNVYVRHTISRLVGPMSFGHHAMLSFPDRPSSGIGSTSAFSLGLTPPLPVERPEDQGYSLLAPDVEFTSLASVPTATGDTADLSAYPARRGYEDVAMIVSEPSKALAWTAAAFPEVSVQTA